MVQDGYIHAYHQWLISFLCKISKLINKINISVWAVCKRVRFECGAAFGLSAGPLGLSIFGYSNADLPNAVDSFSSFVFTYYI
jgi:hypothetical protein